MRTCAISLLPLCRCAKSGASTCIHPHDPPYQVLGLPRIVTSAGRYRLVLWAVDNPHNGLTFCAGSLSAGLHASMTVALPRVLILCICVVRYARWKLHRNFSSGGSWTFGFWFAFFEKRATCLYDGNFIEANLRVQHSGSSDGCLPF